MATVPGPWQPLLIGLWATAVCVAVSRVADQPWCRLQSLSGGRWQVVGRGGGVRPLTAVAGNYVGRQMILLHMHDGVSNRYVMLWRALQQQEFRRLVIRLENHLIDAPFR